MFQSSPALHQRGRGLGVIAVVLIREFQSSPALHQRGRLSGSSHTPFAHQVSILARASSTRAQTNLVSGDGSREVSILARASSTRAHGRLPAKWTVSPCFNPRP